MRQRQSIFFLLFHLTVQKCVRFLNVSSIPGAFPNEMECRHRSLLKMEWNQKWTIPFFENHSVKLCVHNSQFEFHSIYTNLIFFNVRQYRVRLRTLKLHRFIILIIVVRVGLLSRLYLLVSTSLCPCLSLACYTQLSMWLEDGP